MRIPHRVCCAPFRSKETKLNFCFKKRERKRPSRYQISAVSIGSRGDWFLGYWLLNKKKAKKVVYMGVQSIFLLSARFCVSYIHSAREESSLCAAVRCVSRPWSLVLIGKLLGYSPWDCARLSTDILPCPSLRETLLFGLGKFLIENNNTRRERQRERRNQVRAAAQGKISHRTDTVHECCVVIHRSWHIYLVRILRQKSKHTQVIVYLIVTRTIVRT